MSVVELAALGIGVSDLPGWVTTLGEVVGLDVRTDGDRAVVRTDQRAERIVLSGAPTDQIRWVRWVVADRTGLEAAADRLLAAGRSPRWGTATEAAQRRVTDLLMVEDPDGLVHELVIGPLSVQEPLDVDHAGFVGGAEGFGHVVLAVRDEAAALEFFVDLLGLRISDVVVFAAHTGRTGRVLFLRCNRRHHSLALVHNADTPGLRHFMVEYQQVDDMGRCYDRSLAADTVSRHIGMHTNDRTLSHYVRMPSGHEVECGWGSRLVDPTEPVGQFDEASIWGHRRAG
jgi:2,3-dihydroxybiphenyl 1,2-dioxygenase